MNNAGYRLESKGSDNRVELGPAHARSRKHVYVMHLENEDH
jgi:hypothetical protein